MSLAGALLESVERVWQSQRLLAKRCEAGPRFFGIGVGAQSDDALAATGVAFLGPHQRRTEEAVRADVTTTRGQPVESVARWLIEGETLERTAIGAAAVNALLALQLQRDGTSLGDENGLDVLAREAVGKSLAVVGRFPYLDEIRAKAKRSWVLELEPEGDEVGPSDAAAALGEIGRAHV